VKEFILKCPSFGKLMINNLKINSKNIFVGSKINETLNAKILNYGQMNIVVRRDP